MTQSERRIYLIQALLQEAPQYSSTEVPADEQAQQQLLRSLLNVRMPKPVNPEFLEVQDSYLQEELRRLGITDLSDLKPVQKSIYLWQGDITTLKCSAIVNAANSQMLGCFAPCHKCIDNAIHTFAGVQLRLACAKIMKQQGHPEAVGKAKITPAFNLPCDYVLHTVGPYVSGNPTLHDRKLLASCYRSCLELSVENGLSSLAFCCISTGEFHFPNQEAAEIAVETVKDFLSKTNCKLEVIFNVFKNIDYQIYRELLQ